MTVRYTHEYDTRMLGTYGTWLKTVSTPGHHDEGQGSSEECDCHPYTRGLVFSQIMGGVEPYALK